MTKMNLWVGVSCALSFCVAAQAGDIPGGLIGIQSQLVPHHVDFSFAPSGFDDNDNAQIVLDGVYPSTCYKSAPYKVEVDAEKKVVQVTAQAYLNPSSWCAFMMVPFTEVVDLGSVPAGKYSIQLADDHGQYQPVSTQLSIAISQNTIGPDDTLYAPIEDAFIESTGKPGRSAPNLVLRGTLTNTCMKLDTVKVHVTSGNVVEVLPQAKWLEGSEECAMKITPFEKKIALNKAPRGRTLIHVRSLNGKAVNKVVTF